MDAQVYRRLLDNPEAVDRMGIPRLRPADRPATPSTPTSTQ